MKNIETKVKDGKLMVLIDLAEEHGLSKSEKTVIIGSTGGNTAVAKTPDGAEVYLGLNAYRYATEEDKK